MQYLITHWEYGDRQVVKIVSEEKVNDYRFDGYEIFEIRKDGELKKIKCAEETRSDFWYDLAKQRGMNVPNYSYLDFDDKIAISDYLEGLKAIFYNACFELREQSSYKEIEPDINSYVAGILDNIATLLQDGVTKK